MLDLEPERALVVARAWIEAAVVRIHERDAQRSRVRDRNVADIAAAACRVVGDERRRERHRRAVEQRGERNIECGRGGAVDVEAHADRRINAGRDAKAGRHPEARDSAGTPLVEQHGLFAVAVKPAQRIRVVRRIFVAGIAAIVAAAVEAMARTFEHGVGGIERRDARRAFPRFAMAIPTRVPRARRCSRTRVRPREETRRHSGVRSGNHVARGASSLVCAMVPDSIFAHPASPRCLFCVSICHYSGYSAGNGEAFFDAAAGLVHANPPLNARSSCDPTPCADAPA